MSPGCPRTAVASLVLASFLAAQTPAELPAVQKTRLQAMLKRMNMEQHDWVLLQDVIEKTKGMGAGAIPIVTKAAEEADTAGEGRYRIRLLGVLARIDPEKGVAKLKELISAQNVSLATLAARVLGRSGAPVDKVAATVTACLAEEKRTPPPVAGALALAAGDAGAVTTAKLLREKLTGGKLDMRARPWFSTGLAQLAGPDLQAEAGSWLQAESPMLRTGVLLVRRAKTAKVEATLLALYADTDDETLSEWLPQTLAVCGGDAAREALRKALDALAKELPEGTAVGAGDARLLALLRLGEVRAVEWAKRTVAAEGKTAGEATATTMTSAVARLPELLGKWNVAGAADVLVACVNSKTAPCWMRAHAARGLCWRKDVRGLDAAVAILLEKTHGENEFGVLEGLTAAQQTLHEFTANTDRPDYVPVERGEEAKSVATGEEWKKWLQKLGGKTMWREPAPDSDDLLFWY